MIPFVFILFSSTILLIYIALILSFTFGWKKIKEQPNTYNPDQTKKISCIIPFRNEANNLNKLIECLNQQTLQPDHFEIIFVDDHSTDDSYNLCKKLIASHKHYSVIKSTGQGKKNAISTAVTHTKHNYIITTDADCIFLPNWLKALSQYIYKHSPDLIIGPVVLTGPENFFSQFQVIEFLSLVTSGAGAVGIKKPIMCNGANLTVKKEVLLQAQTNIHNSYASGDDIFLLQYCIKQEKDIHFIKSKDAIVYTQTIDDPKQFFNQRMRWTSKSKGYTDTFTLCVAWIVLLSNSLLLIAPIFTYYHLKLGVVLILLAILKSIVDYILLKKGSFFFLNKLTIQKFIFTQAVYPFYIVLTVLLSIFGPVYWKNRKI